MCKEPGTVLGMKYVLSVLFGCFCYVLSVVVTPEFDTGTMQISWEVCFFLWVGIQYSIDFSIAEHYMGMEYRMDMVFVFEELLVETTATHIC